MVLFRRHVKLLIVDAYSPLRRKTRLNFFALVICHHGNPRLFGDNMHRADPWTVGDVIYLPVLSHLRISSLTTSHTLGLSRLCASLEGRESSSRKMRCVHKEGSSPLRSGKFHPIASFLARKTANNLSSWS